MTFVDTSAIYAWVDVNDPEHARAVALLASLLERSEPLLTHSYVACGNGDAAAGPHRP